jgi:hypothetical protein
MTIKTIASLLLPCLLLPTGADPSGGGLTCTVTDESFCNCTDAPATMTVRVRPKVLVPVPGSPVPVPANTGSSGTRTEVVAPGACIYLVYNFNCEETFWGLQCTITSIRLKKRPIANGDC